MKFENNFFAFCCLLLSSWLVESSSLVSKRHHLAKRQALASVCTNQDCRFGTCEILTQYTKSCHCIAGVGGSNCDLVVSANNPCSSNPCYGSGSTCTNSGSTFTCTCPTGLSGLQCEKHTTSCQCTNGGSCQTSTYNGATVYSCTCLPGFGGQLCQFRTTLQTCQILGCQNGGTCTILSVCSCPANYAGNFCEISLLTTAASVVAPQISICFPGVCLNGGTCIQVTSNIGFCQCLQGFSGLYCNIGSSTPTTPLTQLTTTTAATTTAATTTLLSTIRCTFTNPCLNNGVCNFNPTTNAVSCTCLANFEGIVCQTQVAFCKNSPCKNGGTCVSGTGTAGTCTCPTNFEGTYCEVRSSCTTNNPCLNNQPCIEVNGLPFCLCQAGYNLPYCS